MLLQTKTTKRTCNIVIFSDKAYNAIIRETFKWERVETGGILLGHILDNGCWIVMEVLPPGYSEGREGDNVHHEMGYFEYNQRFVNYLANSVATQYKIPLELLGLWHRHPGSMDFFSSTDDGTNKTFASQNPNGAISGLVNVDPKLRLTMYYIRHNDTGLGRPNYQTVDVEVGSDLIPEEYFEMQYYGGENDELHPYSPNWELNRGRKELKEQLLKRGKITLAKSVGETNVDNDCDGVEIPKPKLAPQTTYQINEDAILAAKRDALKQSLLIEGRKAVIKTRRDAIDINENGITLPKGKRAGDDYAKSYFPLITYSRKGATILNLLSRLFKSDQKNVYSSVFAPAEVKRKSHLQVQMYLHLYEETEKVKSLAQESDKNAERRDYIPLQCKLKKGDKVDVQLNIYGETLLMSDKKSVVWQESFTKCSFDYYLPKDIDVDELSCVAMLTVNGVPVGEMRFITRIVDAPRQLNPEVIAHKYNKVFISYSHQDESKVKFLHEGLELGSVPHFFDRKYLKAGDVFPQVIQDYINSADLFILCWSKNASKSEYVEKERLQALERAFPQVKPEQEAKLRIYPMSIEPHAELPSDMKENYHFGEI